MKVNTAERLWSFKELKELFSCADDYLYRLLQSGRLPAVKLASKWVVPDSQLQKYLSQLPSNQKRI